MVFKRTANFLRDEEDLLTLVTDVCVIMGKSPDVQAPLGYHKIPVDLRQTPEELERVPNLDYVYVCYKTDKDITTFERDLLILKKFSDLFKSELAKGSEEFSGLDVHKKYLNLTYNMELMADLAKTINESLLGPAGSYYEHERKDDLLDMSTILWNRFVVPVRKRMEVFIEMKTQKEYASEFETQVTELVYNSKSQIKDVLLVLH